MPLRSPPMDEPWFVELWRYVSNKPSATVPASATDYGTPGEIAYDSSYFYVCVEKDTWKRVAIATW